VIGQPITEGSEMIVRAIAPQGALGDYNYQRVARRPCPATAAYYIKA
jgi:hypothetical protein